MEEPDLGPASSDGEDETQRQRRRRTKHHGPFHLHRAQKRILSRTAIFLALLIVILILWYWIAVRS